MKATIKASSFIEKTPITKIDSYRSNHGKKEDKVEIASQKNQSRDSFSSGGESELITVNHGSYSYDLSQLPSDKTQLEELLNQLVNSGDSSDKMGELIGAIEDKLIYINSQEEIDEAKSYIDMAMNMLETNKTAQEKSLKDLKKLKATLEIVNKISKGTASNSEIRYLLKTSPNLYSMAMSKRNIEKNKESKGNKTTVDLDFDKEENSTEDISQIIDSIPVPKIDIEL